MKQITLTLVWLTIRIDIIPAALERARKTRPLTPLTPSALRSTLGTRLSPHLLKDIGGDCGAQD